MKLNKLHIYLLQQEIKILRRNVNIMGLLTLKDVTLHPANKRYILSKITDEIERMRKSSWRTTYAEVLANAYPFSDLVTL